ncbi:Bgt-50308 [Blumeria graminis f. sp. tritici]|uniref:Bgt-50308 n=1 Tax=Blumeria graminis f. sp. tritici TaxID=62690 RepID=A0A9X9MF99_BLUGR|nr:Bgt-50308 [Blumeria graminis f. sp. tritici]
MDVHFVLVDQYYNFLLSFEMQSWGISVYMSRKILSMAISVKVILL